MNAGLTGRRLVMHTGHMVIIHPDFLGGGLMFRLGVNPVFIDTWSLYQYTRINIPPPMRAGSRRSVGILSSNGCTDLDAERSSTSVLVLNDDASACKPQIITFVSWPKTDHRHAIVPLFAFPCDPRPKRPYRHRVCLPT